MAPARLWFLAILEAARSSTTTTDLVLASVVVNLCNLSKPDVRNPVPYLLVPEEGSEAVLAPLRLPSEGLLGVPLLPLQPLQPRLLEGGAVAHGRRVDDAPVDTGYWAVIVLRNPDPLLPDAY